MTALGPQGPNYSTTRPARAAQASGGVDTWHKDATDPSTKDGTQLDADWFNDITAQLRTAITTAGVTLDATNDSMTWEAMQAAATQALATLTASRGINKVGTDFQLDLGAATNGTLATATVDRITDTLPVWDASASQVKEMAVYEIVKSVLQNVPGAVFNDLTGEITFNGTKHTVASSPPAGDTFGDTWFDTATDTLCMWTNDGASSFWIQIA